MKSILRHILINTLALYIVITYIPGVKLEAGLDILLTAGAFLAILIIFIRPLLKLLLLPINLITLGFFSGLINVIIIYLLDRFIDQLTISEWTFTRFDYHGFIVPEMKISVFWTYFIISIIISLISNTLNWLCD